MILALALLGCAEPEPVDHLDASLRALDLALAHVDRDHASARTTWTYTPRDAPIRTETIARDASGRLLRWRESHADGPTVFVERLDAGLAWTASTWGGVTGTGLLPTTSPPLWLPGGGPALRAWALDTVQPIWDGRGLVDGRLVERTELSDALRLRVIVPEGAWEVDLDARDAVTRVVRPDLSTVGTPDAPDEALVAVATLRHPTAALPAPRGLRRLVVEVRGQEVVVEAVLPEAIPRVPVRGAPPKPEAARIPAVLPLDLDLPRAGDRLELVEAAYAKVRALAGPADDCKALAWRLVGALRHEGVAADVVLGLVYAAEPLPGVPAGDGPAFVHHAWVRVPFGPLLPALDVDPALGQLVADATHLPAALLPPLRPLDPITVIEAVGPDGPVAFDPPVGPPKPRAPASDARPR